MAQGKEKSDFLRTLVLTFCICLLVISSFFIIWYLFQKPEPAPSAEPVPVMESAPEAEEPAPEAEVGEEAIGQEEAVPAAETTGEAVPETGTGSETPAGPGEEAAAEPAAAPVPADLSVSSITIEETGRVIIPVAPTAAAPPAPDLIFGYAYVPEVIITAPTTPVYDDAYFADFFVSGQDSVVYEDGLYYFDFLVDGEAMETLEILFQGDERLMNVTELRMYLGDLLTEAAYETLVGQAAVPGDYVSIAHFTDNGVQVEYDEVAFTINMVFSLEDMPERIISISGGFSRRRTYNLSGALVLEPSWFSWRTGWNLYTSFDWIPEPDIFSYTISLGSNNYLSFGPVGLDFSLNAAMRNGEFDLTWNSYRFFHDFIDEGIRLSWGNIYGFGSSNTYTPLGIQFEKSYSYGNPTRVTNSHRETITVTEESVLLVTRNGDLIYQRTLQPGNYRIQDFAFESGYNEILITVIPTQLIPDGADFTDDAQRSHLSTLGYSVWFDMAYDSQLLAEGETLFGGSFSIGRETIYVDEGDSFEGQFHLRVSPEFYFDYHFDDWVISWWQDVGLTEELTLMTDFSVGMEPSERRGNQVTFGEMSLALRGASRLGTTTGTLDVRLHNNQYQNGELLDLPYILARVDHSWLFGNQYFRGLSTSLWYGNTLYNGLDGDEIGVRASFSGTLGFLRYSMNGNLALVDYDWTDPEWRIGMSFGVTPFSGFNISAGINLYNGGSYEEFTASGHISATISFGRRGSGSWSTDLSGTHSASASFSVGDRDSFSANLTGLDFSYPLDHSVGLSWLHTGDLYQLSARAMAYDSYGRYSGSLSFSTATFFADGVFGVSRSTRDNFVLIRPQGALKDAVVQVSRSNQGTPTEVRTFLGSALYSGLSSYQRNNLVVYVTEDDEFSETQTFAYELNPTYRNGYAVRVSVPEEYTVTGIISLDGVLQTTFTSPVYRVVEEEGGFVLAEDSSIYLFCDQDARFIISGVEPGTYVFDFPVEGMWVAVLFTVESSGDEGVRVLDFGSIDFSSSTSYRAPDAATEPHLAEYDGVLELQPGEHKTSETFWNELFPPVSEEDIWADFAF